LFNRPNYEDKSASTSGLTHEVSVNVSLHARMERDETVVIAVVQLIGATHAAARPPASTRPRFAGSEPHTFEYYRIGGSFIGLNRASPSRALQMQVTGH